MDSKHISLAKLEKSRDAFWFSLGAYALLTKEPVASQVASYDISVTKKDLSVRARDAQTPHSTGTSYRIAFNSSLPESAALSVVQSTFYAMLSDGYEACKAAAPNELRTQEWYHFARHIRNAISHNGCWYFDNARGLPATWRHMAIDQSMQGHEIGGFIGWFDGLQLNANMYLFVSSLSEAA